MFAAMALVARAQEEPPVYGPLPDFAAENQVHAFYNGVVLMCMFWVLVGLLWRSRQQSRHVRELQRKAIEVQVAADRRQRDFLRKQHVHFENTPLVVIELDAQRRFSQWIGRAETVFGWSPTEVVGQPADRWPWVDPEGMEAVRAAFASVAAAPITGRVVTLQHQARNGDKRLIEWHISILGREDDEPETVVGLGLDVTEREESSQALRDEQKRYAVATQAGGSGLWSLDLLKGDLFWEPQLAQLLGYDPADFPTRTNQWLELFHSEDRPSMDEILQADVEEMPMRSTLEVRLRHREGAYRWFRLEFSAEATLHGASRRLAGSAVEITRWRNAEQEFRGLIEHSLAGIFIIQDNRVVYANPRFWTICRSGGSRLPIRPELLDLVQPDDRAMVAEQLHPLHAGDRREVALLFRLAGPVGHTVAVQGHAIATEHEGEPAILGLVMDVSHRFSQEQTSRRLSEVVEQSPVAILITDPAGIIEYANPKFCELSGYPHEELLGQTPRLLHSGEMPEDFYQEIWARLGQGKKWEGEYVNRAKDGRQFTVRANLFPVFDEDGAITHYVEIMEDITSQRMLEERLARAQRLESIGNLAGGIAHDLNNILAPVRLGAEFLKSLPFTGKEREIVEVMDISIHRASELVQQVLAFSRGRHSKREALDPAAAIDELERLARETFPRGVRLETRVAPDLARVYADPTQFLQVMMNLCVNGRDAMPNGGVITIAADNVALTGAQTGSFPGARPGPHVRIRVSDTGTGVPTEVREKIFEPFFTTKDIGKGTGLGLSTALGIVQEHNGIIELESSGAQGTTFVVYLPVLATESGSPVRFPVSAGHAPEAAPREADRPSAHLAPLMVVDDEAPLRQAIVFVLSQRGYTVIEAADGYQAIEKLKQCGGNICVAIIDVMMPRLDGVETVKALRQIRADLPIIATSGVNNDSRLEALRRLGVTQFLLKPYRNHELLEAINACLPPGANAAAG
jgi:PAS domain S-box-containing protein